MTTRPRGAIGAGLRLGVFLVVASSLLMAVPSAAHEGENLEDAKQREEQARDDLAYTQAQIAAARDELVAIQTRLDEAQARLRTVEGQLAFAEEELTDARARAAKADEELARQLEQLGKIEQQLGDEEGAFKDQVASTYKYGSSQGTMWLRLVQSAQTPSELAVGMYKLQSIVEYQHGILERVESLRAAQVQRSAAADAAREDAQRAERDAKRAYDHVTALRDDAAAVADGIATDEARQREILASLESDARAKAEVLEAVISERKRIEREIEEERARRRAAGGGWCPVDGARAGRDFRNDWGYPRSGGRRHEGTDIFADRGTPVRAMFQGTVKEIRRYDGGLGGLFVSYWVGGGEHWYNAHLASVADGLEVGDAVSPGQLIGTVGNSGNARTTPPHLHIGRYVNDEAVNPYPTLEQACP